MADADAHSSRTLLLIKLLGVLIVAGLLATGLVLPYVGGLGLAARAEASKFLDTSCTLQRTPPPEKTTLYARDGKTVIASLFLQDRVPVALSQVPLGLQQALIATEDRHFYTNHGVDLRSALRAAISISNGSTQGASTLTMQYVKQVRYYQDIGNPVAQQADINQNLNRKIEDAKCAIAFEKRESKAQILDNYLNIAFFGENAYGIQVAAQTYFGRNVSALSLPQSALLVGLLRAPTGYDPYLHPNAARARRNQVIQNLVSVGDLSQLAAARAQATPIQLATASPHRPSEGCANANQAIANAGFFCEYAKQWLGSTQRLSANELQTGGFKIVTTLDPNLQNSMQQHLSKVMPADAAMSAVMPAIDTRTGDVLAMATNKHYGTATSTQDNTHTSLPIFTAAIASGASTWKLFSLLTALQIGVPPTWTIDTNPTGTGFTPTQCANAAPATNGDAHEPYTTNESLASGTAKSSNTFFVAMDDVLFGCDLQPIVNLALRMGMTSLSQPQHGRQSAAQSIVADQNVLQLALGSGLSTSPLELAGAYAAVADGGTFNAPAPVLSIRSSAGTPLPLNRAAAQRVLSRQAAAQAAQILEGDTSATYGTSYGPFQAWYGQNPSLIAGKTGTAVSGGSGARNSALWFVGMTPNLVASTAIINPADPYQPISSLPGITQPGINAYGDYASGVWLDTLTPTLSAQSWAWPDPAATANTINVPDITGLSLAATQSRLATQGFTLQQLDPADNLTCASAEPSGTVAFFGPQQAVRGTKIFVCLSSGIPQNVYVPPTPPPARTPANHTTPPKTKPAPVPTLAAPSASVSGHPHG